MENFVLNTSNTPSFLPTIIIRHYKENLKKCSLSGLERKGGLKFFTFPRDPLPFMENYIHLCLDATEVLSSKDSKYGLLILDATWRYAEQMEKKILSGHMKGKDLIKRRLPPCFKTAYPRRQSACCEPESGLASIEALVAAYEILGRSWEGLMDHYYWKNTFLELNKHPLNSKDILK